MRKEYINYKPDMNIDFKLAKIKKYPLVWQDSIRLFFVLKGSLKIGMENEEFLIVEDSIEIINSNESYYIKSDDENLVLMIDIREEFFNRYNSLAKDIYYYTNTLDSFRQSGYKYIKLREFIGILFYEFIQENNKYNANIDRVLLETMTHLLNNFHYLIYEGESLKEDEIQLQRFTRIISHLKKNYNQKVTLTEISEREYLTPQYLSFKIKDIFGQNFNDFLNKIRIEESRKLLLDTDKSISEIAEDIGFSHIRYYNKHFKKIHKMSPPDYRKKYKRNLEEFYKQKDIEYIDINLAKNYLKKYYSNYSGYKKDILILEKNIDLEKETISYLNKKTIIEVGNTNLLEILNFEKFKEMYQQIDIDAVILRGLDVKDPEYMEKLIDIFKELDIDIILDELDDETNDVYKKIGNEKLYFIEKNNKNDTLDIANFYYKNIIDKKNLVFKFRDDYILNKAIFNGDSGLFTVNFIKKPIFYAMKFVSELGDEILYRDDNYIVTASNDGFEILVFNNGKRHKKLSLNFKGVVKDYRYILYSLNSENGSIYDAFGKLGENTKVDRFLINSLKEIKPKVSLGVLKSGDLYNLTLELESKSSHFMKIR